MLIAFPNGLAISKVRDSEEGIGGKLRSPAFGGNCFEFLEVIRNIIKGQVFLVFGQNRPLLGKRSKICRRRLLFRLDFWKITKLVIDGLHVSNLTWD